MNQESTPKSKLIIDEDWKTQVAREKEEFRKAASEDSPPEPADSKPATKESQESEQDVDKLPPLASFALLVSTLGTQALAAMGQLPDGEGEKPVARMDYAKHYIDLLGMLEEKTKSNLSPQESQMLAEWLHQLRMAFVTLSSRK